MTTIKQTLQNLSVLNATPSHSSHRPDRPHPYGIFIVKNSKSDHNKLELLQHTSSCTCLSSILRVERCLRGWSQSNTGMSPILSSPNIAVLLRHPSSFLLIIVLKRIIILIIVSLGFGFRLA